MATITSLGFNIFSRYDGTGVRQARRDVNDLDSTLRRAGQSSTGAGGALRNLAAAGVVAASAMGPVSVVLAGVAAGAAAMGVAAVTAGGIFAGAMVGAIKRTLELAKAHKQLTPVQQQFIKQIGNVKSAWVSFIDKTSSMTLKPVVSVLAGAAVAIGKLTPVVRALAPAFAAVGRAIGNWLSGTGFQRFIDVVQKYGVPALRHLMDAGRDVFAVLGYAFRALAPMIVPISAALARGAEKLREWASGGGFTRFLETVQRHAPQVKDFFKALWDAVVHVADAMDDLGPLSLGVATELLKIVNAMPPWLIKAIAVGFVAIRIATMGWAIATGILAIAQAALAIAMSPFLLLIAGAALTIGIIVLAIAALAAGIYFLVTKTTWLQTAWKYTWNFIKTVGLAVWEVLKTQWKIFLTVITTAFTVFKDLFTGNWSGAWDAIKKAGEKIWGLIGQLWDKTIGKLGIKFDEVIPALKTAWNATWNGMKIAAEYVWNAMKAAWGAVVYAFQVVWTAVSGALVTAWNFVWNGMKIAAEFVWDAMKVAWATVVNAFQIVWTAVSGALVTAWNFVWNGMKVAAEFVWNAMKAAWNLVVQGFSIVWTAVSGALVTAWNFVWNGMKVAAEAIWNGMKLAWNLVVQGFQTIWTAVSGALVTAWNAVWNGIKTTALAIWNAMATAWSTVWNGIKTVGTAIWTFLREYLTAWWGQITAGWNAGLNFFKNLWNTVWEGIKTIAAAVWTWLREYLTAWWTQITAGWNAGLNFFKNLWNTVWEGIKSIGAAVWTWIREYLTAWWNQIKEGWNAALNWIKQLWNDVWNVVKSLGAAAWTWIRNYLTDWWNQIKSAWNAALNWIKQLWNDVWNVVKSLGAAAWTWMRNYLGDWWNQIKSAWNAALNWIKNLWNDVWNVVKNIGAAAWTWLRNYVTDWWSQVKGIFQKGLEWVRDTWKAVWNVMKDVAHSIWSNIGGIIEKAVNGIIGIINALTGGFNKVADFLHIDVKIGGIDKVNFALADGGVINYAYGGITGTPPQAYANGGAVNLRRGGTLSGYAPGRDTVPAVLSKGEGVLVPEAVRGLGGAGFVHAANHHYSKGRAPRRGAPRWGSTWGQGNKGHKRQRNGMGGHEGVRRFADGGMVGGVQHFAVGGLVAAALAKAGISLSQVTQGEHSNGALSAGTHSGGGVVDIAAGPNDQAMVSRLRAAGFAAWLRTPSEGFAYHIHAVLMSAPDLSGPARAQVADYLKGGDGLGTLVGGDDTGGGIGGIFSALLGHMGEVISRVSQGLNPLGYIKGLLDLGDDDGGGLFGTGIGPDFGPDVTPGDNLGDAVGKVLGFALNGAGGIGSMLLGMIGGPAFTEGFKWITDDLKDWKNPAGGFGDMVINMGERSIKGVIDYLTKKDAEAVPQMGGGGDVQKWAGLAAKALAMAGINANQLGAFLALMQAESGGNPNAINGWDSNAAKGQASRGLMQVIPSTFAAYHVAGTSGNIFDPLANMAASANYIKHVYGGKVPGSPYALGTSGATQGWHMVGEVGPEMVKFRGGERVTPNNKLDNLVGGGGGEVNMHVTIDARGADKQAVDQLEKQTIPKMRMLLQQQIGKR